MIVHGNGSNEGPVSEDGWFAWMNSPAANPIPQASRTSVYVRRGHDAAWRANPAGTFAETGGIARGQLIIQLITHGSVLASVDLRTRILKVLPKPFNAPHALAWRPSVSWPWLLYGRITGSLSYSIVLANLATQRIRVLDHVDGHGAYAAPGQVNGEYATWITCPDNDCRAYRYDSRTGAVAEMPPIGGFAYWHFGPSVTRDGTVYFGVGRGCVDVRLMRWRNGHTRTIYRFPPNTAFQYSDVKDTQPRTIYVDEVACNEHALSSIEAIRDTVAAGPER
jgi:hypothetical protein